MDEPKKDAVSAVESVVPSAVFYPQDFAARMSEYREMAEVVIKGGYAPKGVTRPEQVIVAMQVGSELGLPPMRALSCVTVINGKPGVMNEAALGLLRSAGALEPGTDLEVYYPDEKDTDEKDSLSCVVKLHRRGQPEPFEEKFTIAMAKRAKLWGKSGPWTEYPQRMMMWRAIGFLLSKHFSDVLLGLPLESELRDLPKSLGPGSPREAFQAYSSPDTGPDPLLEAIVQGDIDPATEMEILPPPAAKGDKKSKEAVD